MKAKDSLVSEVGVLGRSLPFKYEGGLEKSFIDGMNKFKFETWPDELERRGVKDCSFYIGSSDAVDLHKIMMKYASNLFDEVYETENRFLQDDAMRDLYKYLDRKMNGLPTEYSMANVKLVWGEILFRVTGGHTSSKCLSLRTAANCVCVCVCNILSTQNQLFHLNIK